MIIYLAATLEAESHALLKTKFQLSKDISQADIIIVDETITVDEKFLKQSPAKLIITLSKNFDHIDMKETNKLKIQLANSPIQVEDKVETTWRILTNIAFKHNLQLKNKVIGLIGYGKLNRSIEKIALAYEMQPVVFDPYKEAQNKMGLSELLRFANIVVTDVPHTKETHKMINQRTLQDISTEAIVIHTGSAHTCNFQELDNMALQNRILAFSSVIPLEIKGTTLYKSKEGHRSLSSEALQHIMNFSSGKPLNSPLSESTNTWFK